jgi:hypothetical protein
MLRDSRLKYNQKFNTNGYGNQVIQVIKDYYPESSVCAIMCHFSAFLSVNDLEQLEQLKGLSPA